MRAAILLLAISALPPVVAPYPREVEVSARIAQRLGGVAEYRTPDGSRVDVLTDSVAYEVEWSDKWQQSIGQSVFYGLATNRKPGVILLLRGNESDQRNYLRCLAVCGKLGIELSVESP